MSKFVELARQRHSARVGFDASRHVAPSDLEDILEAARWAPTPHNMQNFEVVVVDDPAVLGDIGQITATISPLFLRENMEQVAPSLDELRRRKTGILGTGFPPSWLDPPSWGEAAASDFTRSLSEELQGCPTLLVVLYDERRRAPASKGDVLGFIGLGCVLENMWLSAQERGIGFQVLATLADGEVEPALRAILRVPAPWRVAFGVRLGFPVNEARAEVRVRRDIEDFAHRNVYGRRVVVDATGAR